MEEKLPKGWEEVQFIEVLETLENGSRPKGGVQGITEGIPSLGGEHLNSNGSFNFEKIKYVPLAYAESRSRGLIKKYDSLIVKDGATTGKTSFVDESFPFKKAFVNEHVFICRPWDCLEKKIVYYFAKSPIGNVRIMENFSGAAQGGINQKFARNTLIPLPPLPEQKRIVAKLDTLFASLNNTKTHLEKIPQLLKNFRLAVLTQAVTGKLTEEWREGKELGEWEIKKAQDCCEKVQSGGTPKKDGFSEKGIPFLKVYNIVNNKINFSYKPQFVKPEAHFGKIKKSIAYPGDVLMNIVGPPLNKVAILPDDYEEWNLNQAITLFRTKNSLLNTYLYYFFCEGSSVRSLMNETRGMVGQVNISLTQCRQFDIPIPPLEEQNEIVRRVESLFAKADAIEQQYQKLKEKVDALPQAILAKAFRGELVEQNPLDEPASVLLERIRAEKEKVAVKGKKKTMKRKVDVAAEPKAKYGKKGNK